MCEQQDFAQELVETRQKDWQAAAMLSQVVVGLRLWRVRNNGLFPLVFFRNTHENAANYAFGQMGFINTELLINHWCINGLNTATDETDNTEVMWFCRNYGYGFYARLPNTSVYLGTNIDCLQI